MAKIKYKCPKCGSRRVWVHISIVAKLALNKDRTYDYEPWNTDNFFEDDCGCDRCGHTGTLGEFEA